MNKIRKTIKKEWGIDPPCAENVDAFIARIKKSCNNMKRDFPNFLSYEFTINHDMVAEYGGNYVTFSVEMRCTRMETDRELETRKKQNIAAKKRAIEQKRIKEDIELAEYARLTKKYKGGLL